VTGIPDGGDWTIAYMIGGQDGGLFQPISDSSFTLSLRPLKIVAAVISFCRVLFFLLFFFCFFFCFFVLFCLIPKRSPR
jgi:hypothetical protein